MPSLSFLTDSLDAARLSEPGVKPVLLWLPIDRLDVDERYQRSLESARSIKLIELMYRQFNWSVFQAIIATKKANTDRWLIIDGQHRVAAARKRGFKEVPAVVIEALSLREQARIFVTANRNRVNLTPGALFHAGVLAGEPRAVKVAEFCQQLDIKIPRYQAPASQLPPNATLALKLIEEIALDEFDLEGRAAIRLLRSLWPNDKGALSAMLIRGVRAVMREVGQDNVLKIRGYLAQRKPMEWGDEYRGHGAFLEFQLDMLDAATGRDRRAEADKDADDFLFDDESPEWQHPVHPLVDVNRRSFKNGSRWFQATAREWAVFEALAHNGGHIRTNESIYRELYGADSEVEVKIIDVFVCKLRKKCPFAIETVWGTGYLLHNYRMNRVKVERPPFEEDEGKKPFKPHEYTPEQKKLMMGAK